MLGQLPYAIRVKFLATLTYIYACDDAVISLMKSRTLDNKQFKCFKVYSYGNAQ